MRACSAHYIRQQLRLTRKAGALARQGVWRRSGRPSYCVTVTFPQAMGAASIKLLRFVPRVTTMYQAVLGAD